MSHWASNEEFIEFYSQAACIGDVASHFGVTKRAVSQRARGLRDRGVALKKFRYTVRRGGNSYLACVWIGMVRRCNSPLDKYFKTYGARGIKVCQEWLDSCAAFQEWAMKSGFERHLEIDRRDVNGNYEPSNCRWITAHQQCMNKRRRSDAKWSQYKGVKHRKGESTWRAQLKLHGVLFNAGPFKTEVEAAIAYDQLAKRHFGEYAYFNFPELITSE